MEQWPVGGGDLGRLRDTLERGAAPQAMILVGSPANTLRIAMLVAKWVLCTGGDPRPCQTCPDCLQCNAGVNPDFYAVETDTKTVRTQDIEDLQSFLQLKSHRTSRRVYIVPRMDTATPVAANRLLKTLEEPTPGTVAILTATNLRQVLPTIISRCHAYRLLDTEDAADSGSPAFVTDVDDDDATKSVFAASIERVVQWTESLLKDTESPLLLAAELHTLQSEMDGDSVLDIVLRWLGALMNFRVTEGALVDIAEWKPQLALQSELASGQALAELIQVVLDTKIRAESHVVERLNFEQMCIRMRRLTNGLHGRGSPLQTGR